jgi:hypothetical protein
MTQKKPSTHGEENILTGWLVDSAAAISGHLRSLPEKKNKVGPPLPSRFTLALPFMEQASISLALCGLRICVSQVDVPCEYPSC